MSNDMYEVLALAARYLFIALIVIIVGRAWRITVIDGRRARLLRKINPDTGLSGELVVLNGGERAKTGMRYVVTREGMLGSSRKADIRIRHSSVHRRHAYYELTENGLSIRIHANSKLFVNGKPIKETIMKDGDRLSVASVELMLVLANAEGEPSRSPSADPLFDAVDEIPPYAAGSPEQSEDVDPFDTTPILYQDKRCSNEETDDLDLEFPSHRPAQHGRSQKHRKVKDPFDVM